VVLTRWAQRRCRSGRRRCPVHCAVWGGLASTARQQVRRWGQGPGASCHWGWRAEGCPPAPAHPQSRRSGACSWRHWRAGRVAGPSWVVSNLGAESSAWAPHSPSSPLLALTCPACPPLISICRPSPTPPGIPTPAELGTALRPAGARSCRHPLPLHQPPKQSQYHAPHPYLFMLTCELHGDLEGDSAWHPGVFLHQHIVPVLPEGQVQCELAGSVLPAVQRCGVVQRGSLGPHTQPERAALGPVAPQHLHQHS